MYDLKEKKKEHKFCKKERANEARKVVEKQRGFARFGGYIRASTSSQLQLLSFIQVQLVSVEFDTFRRVQTGSDAWRSGCVGVKHTHNENFLGSKCAP